MRPQAKIAIGLVAGVFVGGAARIPNMVWLQRAIGITQPLGTIFIRLITDDGRRAAGRGESFSRGIASLGDIRRLGQVVGGKTLAILSREFTLLAADHRSGGGAGRWFAVAQPFR